MYLVARSRSRPFGLRRNEMSKKAPNALLQTIPECSSPQLISITGSFLMKKWLGTLSAKKLLPYVNTAPVSEIKLLHFISRGASKRLGARDCFIVEERPWRRLVFTRVVRNSTSFYGWLTRSSSPRFSPTVSVRFLLRENYVRLVSS